jgi:hypothetical protein
MSQRKLSQRVPNVTRKHIVFLEILCTGKEGATSGWKRGLYAIRVTVGKEVLAEKVQIK